MLEKLNGILTVFFIFVFTAPATVVIYVTSGSKTRPYKQNARAILFRIVQWLLG